ncbi:MAG TPA: glycosyltransferase family 2 protein [Xanthobacteraceae bacterium]|nr:glycosyltransferase family 2 protein [Xanthobacteraceae bacterium]
MTNGSIVYSLIIPFFDEASVMPKLLCRLDAVLDRLDGLAEVIFVDDGSRDDGASIVAEKARDDQRYRLISLSRNFGHQVAITAGMDIACGQAVIVMDADLQDPPELVLDMIAKWKAGYEIVYAERLSRDGEGLFKRITANAFYRMLRHLASVDIPRNVGDFRLVDRKALEVFRRMRERDRFVRGMYSWMGFRQTSVTFHRPGRASGSTKYSLSKMIALSLNGVIGFSDTPLRLALWLGFFISAIAGIMCLYVVAVALYDHTLVPGWASTMVLVSFLSGVNLLMTGVVGLYVGRVHTEVKNRPLYVINRTVGFEGERTLETGARSLFVPSAARF